MAKGGVSGLEKPPSGASLLQVACRVVGGRAVWSVVEAVPFQAGSPPPRCHLELLQPEEFLCEKRELHSSSGVAFFKENKSPISLKTP